jgi:hypothetical protein
MLEIRLVTAQICMFSESSPKDLIVITLVCVIHREGGRHSQIPAVNCAYFRALWGEGVY